MPRFFFHVVDDVMARDDEGTELAGLEAAKAVAVEGARDLASAEIRRGKLSLHHRIEVEDERGDVVVTVLFKSAFEIED